MLPDEARKPKESAYLASGDVCSLILPAPAVVLQALIRLNIWEGETI